jgi:carbamate kinase
MGSVDDRKNLTRHSPVNALLSHWGKPNTKSSSDRNGRRAMRKYSHHIKATPQNDNKESAFKNSTKPIGPFYNMET